MFFLNVDESDIAKWLEVVMKASSYWSNTFNCFNSLTIYDELVLRDSIDSMPTASLVLAHALMRSEDNVVTFIDTTTGNACSISLDAICEGVEKAYEMDVISKPEEIFEPEYADIILQYAAFGDVRYKDS